ncbi:MAG: GNAT family N-acetyltransferase [Acidobacteria bacterium]|nr:GNAT family N-acetyltransferase [Acidobacteriota bacterium]
MTASTEPAIILRDISSIAEMREVEELQKEVWGMSDRDIVPLTQLIAAREVGGILIGAFDGNSLVGFVYGFPGFESGHPVIHSHMAAVKQSYRGHQLGYQLKLAQREQALAQGIKCMSWTFDPLQSLNAHFNFSKLGVVSNQYRVDFYGETSSSFLHRGGTDRLWVSWLLDSPHVKQRLDLKSRVEPSFNELESLAHLTRVGSKGRPIRNERAEALTLPQLIIEIPAQELEDPGLVFDWRDATRLAFTKALGAGYLVEEFYFDSPSHRTIGKYLLNAGKRNVAWN